MVRTAPYASRYAPAGMVCAVDHLAAQAGLHTLRAGGSAADAAVSASAVLAVTTQHMCGMGGDLFALVHDPGGGTPAALNASGRSGSGADPDRLRTDGFTSMPVAGDIRAVPVPGCVDGWLALHHRFGTLPLAEVLAPARAYAMDGFAASPMLSWVASTVAHLPGGADFAAATRPGARVRRPALGPVFDALVEGGRDGFYLGGFGTGLIELGGGEYTRSDLSEPGADWVDPLCLEAWGHQVWTVPPNSQGYLTLAAAWIADSIGLPDDPDDPQWAHLTVEAARQASFDRTRVLHEHADGAALLAPERLAPRARAIDPHRAALLGDTYQAGGTIYLCAVDEAGMGVSLIQSNAAGFGVGIAEPTTGIFLHNRGLGFNLVPGHPAEYGPRRRPPHTLSPAVVTSREGRLQMVIGTMGGDSQPQTLLQLLARMLHSGEDAGSAIAAPRWTLENPAAPDGFSTWKGMGRVGVCLEPGSPAPWVEGLAERGHVVRVGPNNFGHAHVIVRHHDHLEGASDPRSLAGDAAGY